MIEILQYSFMVRALLAGAVIGIVAPLIGSFLVTKRYALMADSLSHIALTGIALGLLVGVYPVYVALGVSVAAALVIEYLRSRRGISGETVLAMFLYGGLATALLLISAARGFNVDLFSYLFGSIVTVRETDLWVIGGLGLFVLVAVVSLYRSLVAISFSEEAARVSGVPVGLVNSSLVMLTAVTVSLAMRIVGLLLIGALMVIPVVAAMQVARSFAGMVAWAMGFGLMAVLVGVVTAYYLNLAAGGAVVMVALLLFGVSSVVGRWHK